MNYNEILARIQKGENEEALVKEFTDNLNKAIAENNAAKEARAKEDAKSKKKDEIAVAIANALNEYVAVSGYSLEKFRGADVREMLDEMLPLAEQFKDVKIRVAKTAPKAMTSIDDVFGNFFKELGI